MGDCLVWTFLYRGVAYFLGPAYFDDSQPGNISSPSGPIPASSEGRGHVIHVVVADELKRRAVCGDYCQHKSLKKLLTWRLASTKTAQKHTGMSGTKGDHCLPLWPKHLSQYLSFQGFISSAFTQLTTSQPGLFVWHVSC